MSDLDDIKTADITRVVRTVPVQIGNIFQILNKVTEAKEGASEKEGLKILEALSTPDFNVLEVTLDNGVASLSLHEDLVELLRDNGFKEDL